MRDAIPRAQGFRLDEFGALNVYGVAPRDARPLQKNKEDERQRNATQGRRGASAVSTRRLARAGARALPQTRGPSGGKYAKVEVFSEQIS